MGKKFQDLDLNNAYLFAAAIQDEETCRLILQTILGKEIKSVKVHAEHTLFYSTDFKSVRLDIYARDEMEVSYNIEMQNESSKNLAKRSRFYQSEIDITALKPGEDYSKLKPSYIIFICTFDPFGDGLYRYTFRPYCKEMGQYLEDGTQRIFLNTKGKNDSEVPKELIHFLHYIENSTEEAAKENADETVNCLHNRVQDLKKNRNLEVGYMYLQELLDDKKVEGIKEGQNAGRILGKIEDIIGFLADLGEIPEDMQTRIEQEQDIRTLSKWVKLAARAETIEEFIEKM